MILKARKLYYKQAIEKSNNEIKTTWSIINEEKGLHKRKSMIKKISHNNRITINQKTIANLFNNHFLSIADLTKIENITDINPYIENSLKYLKMCNEIPFDNITWKYVITQETKKIISSLKNSNSTG